MVLSMFSFTLFTPSFCETEVQALFNKYESESTIHHGRRLYYVALICWVPALDLAFGAGVCLLLVSF